MDTDFKKHLSEIKFECRLKKMIKKLKNKKVIIYGAGSLFQYITENYDLSSLNIIGVSDMKFQNEDEGAEFLGYKIIPKEKMPEYSPDCVLIATLNYIGLLEYFQCYMFKGVKTKVAPLAQKSLFTLLKEIWSE